MWPAVSPEKVATISESEETDLRPEVSVAVGMRSMVVVGVISGRGGRGFGWRWVEKEDWAGGGAREWGWTEELVRVRVLLPLPRDEGCFQPSSSWDSGSGDEVACRLCGR